MTKNKKHWTTQTGFFGEPIAADFAYNSANNIADYDYDYDYDYAAGDRGYCIAVMAVLLKKR
ncbi:MAG: hypothetical protein OSA42_01475 [Porticoccaceae bacterium]|nr:hypothetical protein [Porticoccaceae bacterium]